MPLRDPTPRRVASCQPGRAEPRPDPCAYLTRQVDDLVAQADKRLPRRPYLTPDEVAKFFDLSVRSILRLIADRKLAAIRVGRQHRVPRAVVLKMIRENAAPAYPTRLTDYDE